MKKGHLFMLQVPMLRVAKLVVGKVCHLPETDPFTVHSIASIAFDGTKATIIGYVAKEERKDD